MVLEQESKIIMWGIKGPHVEVMFNGMDYRKFLKARQPNRRPDHTHVQLSLTDCMDGKIILEKVVILLYPEKY